MRSAWRSARRSVTRDVTSPRCGRAAFAGGHRVGCQTQRRRPGGTGRLGPVQRRSLTGQEPFLSQQLVNWLLDKRRDGTASFTGTTGKTASEVSGRDWLSADSMKAAQVRRFEDGNDTCVTLNSVFVCFETFVSYGLV